MKSTTGFYLANLVLMVLMVLMVLVPPVARADVVGFEIPPVGTVFGAPVGDAPGDFLFSEDGADVYITNFLSGGSPYFNFCRVEPSFGAPVSFHDGNIMNVNNVDLVFDFSAPGDASFEYLDFGGSVNLQVNGYGGVLEAADLADLVGPVAPGVTMNATVVPVPGGHKGTVTLTGNVQRLRVGGQEFYLDDVEGADGGPGPEPCDHEVDHQSLAVGQGWGSSFSNSPGDYMFTEDGIPVFADFFHWASGGGTFGNCIVDLTPVATFGYDRVMLFNNINNRYDIAALGITTQKVTFEYLDFGGEENLQVNGAALHVGDLDAFPVNVAPGVTMSVTTWPVGGGQRGYVVLTGDVQQLMVGGQEFFADNICVIEAEEPGPGPCDRIVDNESQPVGTVWGSSYGHVPGDIIFSEDGINVHLLEFDYGTGTIFNEARITSPVCGLLDSHAMWLNNITAGFDLGGVQPVTYVSFEFCDCGGEENLLINGNLWFGEFEDIPAGFFGADITVATAIYGYDGCEYGTVTITGPLDMVGIGGQELQIDNFCVIHVGPSAAPREETPRAGIDLEGSFPNPFNPGTTIAYRTERDGPVELLVYDLAGRRVATLVDGPVVAGTHEVYWNGRDRAGRAAAAGTYLVRLRADNQVVSRKITMVK